MVTPFDEFMRQRLAGIPVVGGLMPPPASPLTRVGQIAQSGPRTPSPSEQLAAQAAMNQQVQQATAQMTRTSPPIDPRQLARMSALTNAAPVIPFLAGGMRRPQLVAPPPPRLTGPTPEQIQSGAFDAILAPLAAQQAQQQTSVSTQAPENVGLYLPQVARDWPNLSPEDQQSAIETANAAAAQDAPQSDDQAVASVASDQSAAPRDWSQPLPTGLQPRTTIPQISTSDRAPEVVGLFMPAAAQFWPTLSPNEKIDAYTAAGAAAKGAAPSPLQGPFADAARTVAEAGVDYGSGVKEASSAFVDDPGVATGVNVIGALGNLPLVNRPYEWQIGVVGDVAYDHAKGKPDRWTDWRQYTTLTQYADANWVEWSENNPEAIINAYENGVDSDGDGVVDLTGGQAAYAEYLKSLPQDQGFWAGENSLVSMIVRAATLDPLVTAALVSGGAAGVASVLQQKVSAGVALTTTEKMLYYAARGTEAVGTVPNELADLPFQAIGSLGRGFGGGVRRVTGWDPSAMSRGTRESDYAGGLTEAFAAQDAARLTADEVPVTATDESQVIQQGARLPQRPTGQPTTGQTASAIPPARDAVTVGTWDGEGRSPTTGQTTAAATASEPYVVVKLGPDDFKVVDPATRRPVIDESGREIPHRTRPDAQRDADARNATTRPQTPPPEMRAPNFVTQTLRETMPTRAGESIWDDPSKYLPAEILPEDPLQRAALIDRYTNDPRTPAFQESMRRFDAAPEKIDLRNAGLPGPALDSAEQIIEKMRNAVESQRPIYREITGQEPKPYRFTQSTTIDKAVPTITQGGATKGARASGRGNEAAIVEFAVFGTDAEAKAARRWMHIQVGRNDLPAIVHDRYRAMLDETTRLRRIEQAAAGGQQAIPTIETDEALPVSAESASAPDIAQPDRSVRWPGEPTNAPPTYGGSAQRSPFPGLWKRAKQAPTVEEGVAVMQAWGRENYGPREKVVRPGQRTNRAGDLVPDQGMVYEANTAGRGWKALDLQIENFRASWGRMMPEAPTTPITSAVDDAVELAPPQPQPIQTPSAPTISAPTPTPLTGPRRARGVIDVDPRQVIEDPSNFQPRSQRSHKAGLNEATVQDIVTNFDENRFDPIRVWRRPEDGAFVVLSGHHRLEAARRLGLDSIQAVVTEGDLATAKRIARQSNSITILKPSEYGRALRAEMEEGKSATQAANIHKLRSGDAKRFIAVSHLPENLQTLVDDGQLPVTQAAVLGEAVKDGTLSPAAAQAFHQEQMLARHYTATQLEDIMNGLRYRKDAPVVHDMFSGMALGAPQSTSLFAHLEELGTALREQNRILKALKTLNKSSLADPADAARLTQVEAKITELSEQLGRSTPPGAYPGEGPNLAGLLFEAVDRLPGPKVRQLREVPSLGESNILTEADRQFEDGQLTRAQRDILNEAVVYNGLPMSVAELFEEQVAIYGRKEGEDRAIALLKELKFGPKPKGPLQTALRKYDTGSSILRELIQFNIVTGARGSLGDLIGDGTTMVVTGHGGAVARQPDIRATRQIYGAITSDDMTILNELPELAPITKEAGVSLPHELMPNSGSYGQADTAMIGETTLHRTLTRNRGNRLTGAITGVFANKHLRDLRTALDFHRRISLYADTFLNGLGEARASFEGLARKRLGVNAEALIGDIEATAKARAIADGRVWNGVFSPDDVRLATRDTTLARAWREELDRLDQAARKEVGRVLFDYRKTSADAALSRVSFFHYWQSRAIPLHARTALKNPWLLATYWRTWHTLGDMAERDGYPKSVTGYLRFMGDSAFGWQSYFDPMGIVLPYRAFMEASPEQDKPFWEEIGLFLNPIVEGAAAAIGMTDKVPDLTGTYSVRNALRAGFDWGNAHGLDFLPGGDSPSADFIRTVEVKIYSTINNALRSVGIPVGVYEPFNQRASQVVQIRSRIGQLAIEQYGPPNTWTDTERQTVADAMIRADSGASGNPLSEQAWRDYTDAQVGTRLTGAAVPGGVRTYFGPLLTDREQSSAGFDALDQGQQPTAAQQQSMDIQSLVNAGSPEDVTLTSQQQGYNAIGTPTQRTLAQGWDQLAYGDITELGVGYVIDNGKVITTRDLVTMSEAERIAIADRWVKKNGGTEALETYREQRRNYRTDPAHTAYGAFDLWQNAARDFPGGIPAFREMLMANSPSYKKYINQLPLKTQKDPAALDRASISTSAYLASQGKKASIYDTNPGDPGSGPLVSMIAGLFQAASGKGASKTYSDSPEGRLEKLDDALADWKVKEQIYNDAVSAVTGGRTLGNGPNDIAFGPAADAITQQLDARGITQPRKPAIVKTYLDWVAAQPDGSDISTQAFSVWFETFRAQIGQVAA